MATAHTHGMTGGSEDGWPRPWRDALLDIARQAAGTAGSSGEDVLQRIAGATCELLPADFALVAGREADGEHGRFLAHAGLPPDRAEALRVARFHFARYPLARRAYLGGETLIVNDVTGQPGARHSSPVLKLASRAFVLIPLTHDDHVIGTFSVHFKDQAHEWSGDELSWLQTLAGQAAVALILSRTSQAKERDLAIREALHTASQRLQSAPDLDTVIEATMEGVTQVVPCVGVCVHLLNEQATEATIAGLMGFKRTPSDISKVVGYKYPANDSVLNSRTLINHEAFYLHDFQVEADTWHNSDAPTLRAWMSVPLMSSGRCFGKITLDHELPDVYGSDELAIVQTFAAHAASAIERAYLYAETASRAEHMSALYHISQELVAARNPFDLYEILRRRTVEAFVADVFFVCLARSEEDYLDFPLLVDEGIEYEHVTLEPKPGPVSEVLRTGRGLCLKGQADWDRFGSIPVGNRSRHSEAAMFAPLSWNGTTLGVISVQTYQDRAYSLEEFQAFRALGATTALALARIQSEQATTERAAQFAALAQSASALVSNLDLSDVLQTVVDRASELTGGEATLMLYDPLEDRPSAERAPGDALPGTAGDTLWHQKLAQTGALRTIAGLGEVAFREQRTIVVEDTFHDDRTAYRRESPMRSLLALPLTVGSSRMGVLELAWPEARAVTPERLALCTAFADHAALAMHNARQHEQLRRREAERTGLLRQLLTAQEAERKRVSIDLHDGPLQSLGVGLINADTLKKRAASGNFTPGDIDILRRDFAAVVDEVRGLIADLRPEVLDSYGLLPALQAHARRIRETTNLDIVISCDQGDDDSGRLPPYIEVLIYRLVQESLSNVRKHAHATLAQVDISFDEGHNVVTVKVEDNGRGFNPRQLPERSEGFGLGLSSMAERVESAGGTMIVDSAPGRHTTLIFVIPLPSSGVSQEEESASGDEQVEWQDAG